MMQTTNEIASLERDHLLPAKHMECRRVQAAATYMLAGRGSWKTSRGIAMYILEKVEEMPGSTGVGIGISYRHLEKNTLPPLKAGFIDLGLVEGEDFVIGKKPPEGFEKPILGLVGDAWKYTISFKNGTIIQLVSLKVVASANGISAQWGFFDEAKFMNEKQLRDEIYPIFRGLDKRFKHCHGYLSKFFATDKKMDPVKIKWLLNKRRQHNPKRVQVVLALQAKLDELNVQLANAGINASAKLKREIFEIDERLRKLRQAMVYVIEISAAEVRPIMGETWWRALIRDITSEYDYQVLVLNKDPDKAEVSFYPDFDEKKHIHHLTGDYDTNRPLIIAIDYQHEVSPICVAQLSFLAPGLPMSLNYVDEVYTLAKPIVPASKNGNGSKGELQEALELFCKRFANHTRRVIWYVFDSTAKGKRVNADRYYDTVQRELRHNRWTVVLVDTGRQPGHYQKYIDTKDWLKENQKVTKIPIRISARCEKTIVSINGTAAITVGTETKKDKKAETEEGIDQSETTHFSDTFDMLNHSVLKLEMVKPSLDRTPLAFGRAA